MSEAHDAFIQDYLTRRSDRIKTTAWEQSLPAQQYLALGDDPRNLASFFDNDPGTTPTVTVDDVEGVLQRLPFLGSKVAGAFGDSFTDEAVQGMLKEGEKMFQARKSEFVNTVETAIHGSRGQLGLDFWLQWTPDEIRLLGGPGLEDVAGDLEGLLQWQADERERLRLLEQQVDTVVEARSNWRSTSNNFLLGAAAIGESIVDVFQGDLNEGLEEGGFTHNLFQSQQSQTPVDRDQIRKELELTQLGRRDELFEEPLQAYVAQLRGRMEARGVEDLDKEMTDIEQDLRLQLRQGADPNKLFGELDGYEFLVDQSLQSIGTLMSAGVDLFGPGVTEMIPSWGGEGNLYGELEANFEEERQALIADRQAALALPDDELFRKYAHTDLRNAYEDLQRTNPNQFNEYERMGGDVVGMGFAFFAADAQEWFDAEDQMADYRKSIEDTERDLLQELEERDFKAGAELLDVLAMYGRNVPGRLSTAFMLMLTNSDFQDQLVTGQFTDLWNDLGKKVEEVGFSPSAAIGIDGSVAGLMLDLGGEMAFDPATWLFGPRFAGGRGVKAASAADAARLARSPFVSRWMDDIARFRASPTHGASDIVHLSSWLDEAGQLEVATVAGYHSKSFGAASWKNTPDAIHAVEVETSFLRQVAGVTDDVADPAFVQSITDDLNEVLELTYSRADGTLHLTDGNKRLLAAEAGGHTALPVKLRVVDDAAAGSFVHADDLFKPEHVERLQEIAAGQHATEGVRVAGADDAVRQESLSAARAVDSRPELTNRISMGTITGKDGRVYNLFRGGEENFIYYVTDEAGEVAASVMNLSSGGIGMGTAEGAAGQGLMEQMFRRAHADGDYVLLQSGLSGSLSDDALGFTQNLAKKLLDEAQPQLATPGISMDDLLREGESLKKGLKRLGSGENVIRPDGLLPRRLLHGELDEGALRSIAERAINRGMTPAGVQKTALAIAWNGKMRKLLRKNKVGQWLERNATPQATVTRFELHGPGSLESIYDSLYRIFGDDTAALNVHMERILQWQAKSAEQAAARTARLEVLQLKRAEMQPFMDATGGSFDDISRLRVDRAADEVTQANQEALGQMYKEFEREAAMIHGEMKAMTDVKDLAKILEDAWDDFNRNHIATRSQWKSLVDPDTGMVPWDQLKKGLPDRPGTTAEVEGVRRVFSDDMKAAAESAGVKDPDALFQQLSTVADMPMAFNAPLSPLEMVMASELGGAAYTRATHIAFVSRVREIAWNLQNWWIIDKVFKPATAVTVSFDELLRMWHYGGMHQGFGRWMADRGLYMQARAASALHAPVSTKLGLTKDAVRKGGQHLSAKAEHRINQLTGMPNHLKQAERQMYEANGLGWTDITPDQTDIYMDAAQRWTGGQLADSGFRAMLRGEDAFREWFFTTDADRLRNAVVLNAREGVTTGLGGSQLEAAQNAYKGWKTLFEDVMLDGHRKAGTFDEVRQMFVDAAAQMDATGGRQAVELPALVYEHLGPIRGVRKELTAKTAVSKLTDTFFDRLFMDPVNYRRGFLAEMVRESETARLKSLFASQNKRIVSDMELERVLGLSGINGVVRNGMKGWLHDVALKQGVVPQSMLDDMVERVVRSEVDNVLFTWDRSSRFGSQSRIVFPFGRPWADMAGFWGREVMRRPVLRGWVNESNFLGMRSLVEAGPGNPLNVVNPFNKINPKPLALTSRLAHTDFTIDSGLIGGEGTGFLHEGGILPGSDETNFSPIFFLPTGGDNPFGQIIPGLGFVPIAFIDRLLMNKYDPVEQPVEYQQLVDEIGEFIPSVRFQQGGLPSRLLGGGTTGSILEMGADVFGAVSGVPFYNLSSELGDIDREINRTREISALLGDDEEWAELMALDDPEQIDLYLRGLAVEADRRASRSHLLESVSRFIIPASQDFDTALPEIQNVWITAADQFPNLSGRTELDKNATDEERRQYVDSVRRSFFKLPGWERDLMVAQYPQLAVNLVSSWVYTPKAINEGLGGPGDPYRTDGTTEGLARHQNLVNSGMIRPMQPIERARLIVGLAGASKERAAKYIYEYSANFINDSLWENTVSEDSKVFLQSVIDTTDFDERFGFESARELWEAWGSYEDDLEQFIARLRGVDPESEEFDALKDSFKIPTKEKAWGTSWPGLNDENVSGRFRETIFNSFPEEVQQLADGLGITLTPGMNGMQLFSGVQDQLTQVDTPIFGMVRAAYQGYSQERSQKSEAARFELSKLQHNPDLDVDWRQTVTEWMSWADRTKERYGGAVDGVPLESQREAAARYMRLWMTSDDLNIDWAGIWEARYAKTYGPLEWEAPVPAEPVTDGRLNPNAYQPFIQTVTDGDTLVVKRRQGEAELTTVRLLGVRAADFGIDDEGAMDDKEALIDALQQAIRDGDRIYLVRDPLQFDQHTDQYGRELAWLWIGDEPYYFEEDFRAHQTPTRRDR